MAALVLLSVQHQEWGSHTAQVLVHKLKSIQGLSIRVHEIKQILTGIAGLIDVVKIASFGLVSFDLVPISRRTMFSKLAFFRLRF